MKHNGLSVSNAYGLAISIVVASLMFTSGALASGATETTIYTFGNPPDGEFPAGPVVFDKAGNIYGTTAGGGKYGDGTVFELMPPAAQGDPWTETILYSFTGGSDGSSPSSGVILGSKGALYGETNYGGSSSNAGVVFKLTPPAEQGGNWTESVIYSFCPTGVCSDGKWPSGGLVFDKKGNLYGTTGTGGTAPPGVQVYGVVFELMPQRKQTAWRESVLYTFLGNDNDGDDGAAPDYGVIFDKTGNLYGTTRAGGNYSACQSDNGCGTVFELTLQGGTWSESQLYAFQGSDDGDLPLAGLVLDKSGALYGTTYGSGYSNYGNVFKLTPPAGQNGQWTETVLYNFQGFDESPFDGYWPAAGVIFDGKDIFGTTARGGSGNCNINGFFVGCGTVFKLIPPKTGSGAWTEKILWEIPGGDNAEIWPTASLTLKGGAFYGTAAGAPDWSGGGVFEVVP